MFLIFVIVLIILYIEIFKVRLLPSHTGFVLFRLSHWGVNIRSQTILMRRLSSRSLHHAINQPVLRVPNSCMEVLHNLRQEIVFREVSTVNLAS